MSLEDTDVERNADNGSRVPEISDGNKNSTRNVTWGRVCDILSKNLALFCPCPGNLTEVEFEQNGVICLTEEISRQGGIPAGAEEKKL